METSSLNRGLAGMAVVAAVFLAGCGEKHLAAKRCVDESGTVADNAKCEAPADSQSNQRPAHKYAWVYAPEQNK